MGQCINCGSQTVFDIKSQQLACVSCGSTFPVPADIVDPDGGFTINTFSCPTCGAELNTTDTSMAEFCSYCGSSVVLAGSSRRCARPKMVAPFRVSKDRVREEFKKKIAKVKFLAPEFRDDKHIEAMRGIYIPYWSYRVGKTGSATGYYETRTESGNYTIVKKYRDDFNVQGSYDGILYDASSAFADDLSEDLKPFSIQDAVPFQSGYLSGFYADSPDTSYNEYLTDAQQSGREYLQKDMERSSGHLYKRVDATLDVQAAQGVMIPIWFMTYRRNDRVAYMVANGQTGKLTADLPVDYKKAFLSAGLIALISYILMMFLPALHPKYLLILCNFMILPVCLMFTGQVRHTDPVKAGRKSKALLGGLSFAVFFITFFAFGGLFMNFNISGREVKGICHEALAALCGITFAMLEAKARRGSWKDLPFFLLMYTVPVFSLLIALVNPVNDYIYYAVGCLTCVLVVISLVLLLYNYEQLATRETPHFTRKGGDNRAY